jgi:predicted amidohydrolase
VHSSIDLIACTLDFRPEVEVLNLSSLATLVWDESLRTFNEGASVVLWPEYLWSKAGIGTPEKPLDEAEFLETVAPLFSSLLNPNQMLVAGTLALRDANGDVRNQAIIVTEDGISYQAKIALAPREQAMQAGQVIRRYKLYDWSLAVLICMDVEIPEISVLLRQAGGVDLLLVPGLADDQYGSKRLSLGIEARAMELGVYGLLCRSSLGKDDQKSSLVAFPPLQAFRQGLLVEYEHRQNVAQMKVVLPHKLLRLARRNWKEANPALCKIDLLGENKLLEVL